MHFILFPMFALLCIFLLRNFWNSSNQTEFLFKIITFSFIRWENWKANNNQLKKHSKAGMSFKFLNPEMRKTVKFKARRRQSDCNVSQGRAKSVFKSDPTAKMMTGKENNMNIRPRIIKDVFPPLHVLSLTWNTVRFGIQKNAVRLEWSIYLFVFVLRRGVKMLDGVNRVEKRGDRKSTHTRRRNLQLYW